MKIRSLFVKYDFFSWCCRILSKPYFSSNDRPPCPCKALKSERRMLASLAVTCKFLFGAEVFFFFWDRPLASSGEDKWSTLVDVPDLLLMPSYDLYLLRVCKPPRSLFSGFSCAMAPFLPFKSRSWRKGLCAYVLWRLLTGISSGRVFFFPIPLRAFLFYLLSKSNARFFFLRFWKRGELIFWSYIDAFSATLAHFSSRGATFPGQYSQ